MNRRLGSSDIWKDLDCAMLVSLMTEMRGGYLFPGGRGGNRTRKVPVLDSFECGTFAGKLNESSEMTVNSTRLPGAWGPVVMGRTPRTEVIGWISV